jgi:hypothetical protein
VLGQGTDFHKKTGLGYHVPPFVNLEDKMASSSSPVSVTFRWIGNAQQYEISENTTDVQVQSLFEVKTTTGFEVEITEESLPS